MSQPLILPIQSQAVLEGKLFDRIWYVYLEVLTDRVASGSGIIQNGTRGDRIAADGGSLVDSTLWFETDTGLIYQWRVTGLSWVYIGGEFATSLANLPTITTLLSGIDTGLILNLTDYKRRYQWTGSSWTRAPGERPTREFGYFAEDPGIGWHLCDGSAGVTYTKDDGSTATMTMPNETAGVYRKSGAAFNASTTPGNLAAVTGTSTGTSAGTPSGTNSAPIFSGSAVASGPNNSGTNATAGGVTVASNGHTHDVVAAGSVSAPTFTGDLMGVHTHSAGTMALAAVAQPDHITLLPYMKL